MKILIETDKDFPFDWASLNSYRDSNAFRKEVYLKKQDYIISDLIFMFYSLFGSIKKKIKIYNKSWWDFCIDTWDYNKDEYNYDLDGKSLETQEYLKILKESGIQQGYSGCCFCEDWNVFLPTILKCIINHKAPYSPIFYDEENNFFFYFHHTGSIGLYYKEENSIIKQILLEASRDYYLED